jgi:O-succinylbenzoate synthase
MAYTVKTRTYKEAFAVLVFDTQEAADAFANKMGTKVKSRKEFPGNPTQSRSRALQHLEDSGLSVDWQGDTGAEHKFMATHGAVAVRGRGRPGAE